MYNFNRVLTRGTGLMFGIGANTTILNLNCVIKLGCTSVVYTNSLTM